MREEYLRSVAEYRDRLEPRMWELEGQRKWRRLARDLVPGYSFQNTGVVFVFRVLEESGKLKEVKIITCRVPPGTWINVHY
ncbi:hypothetical protein RRG08_039779 [Elysia crispata]|uniref:Uncharacterized protein n=1 Tax=Elysia crispata TaxID=231223 RepID=A0AAE1AS88_9GAST|nr:hypothetical protein RRG08_039779 [Elysia crispata]